MSNRTMKKEEYLYLHKRGIEFREQFQHIYKTCLKIHEDDDDNDDDKIVELFVWSAFAKSILINWESIRDCKEKLDKLGGE